MELADGTLFHGKYRILEKLGSGATKKVWKAEDEVQGRTVALKLVAPEQLLTSSQAQLYPPDLETIALRESKLLTSIGKHPNIAEIYDANIDEKTKSFFIAEEYVSGKTLDACIDELGTLGTRKRNGAIIRYARQIIRGLQHLEQRNIVHGDLTLKNILLSGKTIKITDFGQSQKTGMMEKAGSTFIYQSPEQISDAPAHIGTNIWQLGVILYRAITGEFPFISKGFEKATPEERKLLRDELKQEILNKSHKAMPSRTWKDLRKLVNGCLQKSPEKRISTRKAYSLVSPWKSVIEMTQYCAVLGLAACLAYKPASLLIRKVEGDGSTLIYTTISDPDELRSVDGKFIGDLPFYDAKTPINSMQLNAQQNTLAYTTKKENLERLILLDIKTGKEQEVLSADAIFAYEWAPDDRLAAIVLNNERVGPNTELITLTREKILTKQFSPLRKELHWHPSGNYLSIFESGELSFIEPGKESRIAEEYPKDATSHQWFSKGLVLNRPGGGDIGPGLWIYQGEQKTAAKHVISEPTQFAGGEITLAREFRDKTGYWYLSHNMLNWQTWNNKKGIYDATGLKFFTGKGVFDAVEATGKDDFFILVRKDDIDRSGGIDINDTEIYRIKFEPLSDEEKLRGWDYGVKNGTKHRDARGVTSIFYIPR